MTADRHLVIRSRGVVGTVALDGVELQDGLRGLNLTLTSDGLPTLRLDPLIVTGDVEHEGPLHVTVPPQTHRTLVALGWTPPAGGDT